MTDPGMRQYIAVICVLKGDLAALVFSNLSKEIVNLIKDKQKEIIKKEQP